MASVARETDFVSARIKFIHQFGGFQSVNLATLAGPSSLINGAPLNLHNFEQSPQENSAAKAHHKDLTNTRTCNYPDIKYYLHELPG